MKKVLIAFIGITLINAIPVFADDLNGSTSVETITRILNNKVVQDIIKKKGATLQDRNKALTFKGIRQTMGVVGRCLGCVPSYYIIFDTNLFYPGTKNVSECFVLINDKDDGTIEVSEDRCVGIK